MNEILDLSDPNRPDPDAFLENAARQAVEKALRKAKGDLIVARRWLEYQKRCRRVGNRVRAIHDRALALLAERPQA